MYKLIELTENETKITDTGWVANITNEAIESQYPLIVVEKVKNEYFLIGKKFEGETFEWLQQKEQIKHAFNISSFEGYATFEVGYVTDDYAFIIEKKEYLVEDIVEDLEGFHIQRGMLYFCEADEETYHKFEDYEMSKDDVKEFIKVQGYEYTEL